MHYAHIQHTNGRKTTKSIRHLAPSGSPSGSTQVLQWHDPQAETGSLIDTGTVVEGENDDHPEDPAEDISTTITTTEKTPTSPLHLRGQLPLPLPCQQTPHVLPHLETQLLLRHSRRHQRHAPDKFGYPFESRGQMM